MTASAPLAVALMGPTASGKTDTAIGLAHALNGEIISVDSALVYRGLNIGAAKPSLDEQAGIPHHLMDICDPAQPYSVADFVADARQCINDIVARGRTPILAGGTMMYFKALLEGLSDIPPADPEIREAIEAQALREGWPAIHAELAKVDPLSAERIHPNHSQRLGRALEVWRSTGKPLSSWQSGGQGGLLDQYTWVQLALAPRERSVLHARIALRFERMLEQGFIDEVKALRARGDLNVSLPAIRAVGYRQVWAYLDGDYDYDALIDKGVAATRQLAKRQLTWLRGWPGLNWVDTLDECQNLKDIEEIVHLCLSFCRKSTI